ncbi:MAG TPA: sugar phosphate nucleotidyltransferase [Chloroflexota bacterium]|nr:sugar phosphate nucleotidyltransferase [Chloroflexota bacterium]
MKAVVMAGGEGSRLRPLTLGRPKPMVPIVSRPVMEHILLLLKQHGITDVVVTLQYMAGVIQNYFGDGSQLGMHIDYTVEDVPLGTAGSVKQAQHLLTEPFLVISGDALTDYDLTAIIEYHKQRGAMATLTLARVANPLEYGVVITNDDGTVRQFLEKPSWSEVFSDTVNTGIYVLEPKALNYVPSSQSFDFSQDLFPILMRNGDPIYGYIAEGYWCDVGNLEEYARATRDVLEGRARVVPSGRDMGNGIWMGERVDIAPDARLVGPIWLGDEVKIGPGAEIIGPTVIRPNTIVDRRATIDRSVIWRSCYVGERAEIRGGLLARQVSVKSNAVIFEGTVIGDNSTIEEGAIIRANVKIWPNKQVEAGATVSSSIIWGQQGRRLLFGRNGVSGLANIDMTPEFAAKLGAAYGGILPLHATVAVNRDLYRTSRMIKRGIVSGLSSAGVNVWDLTSLPLPVARYFTRISAAVGAVHVRVSLTDRRMIDVKLMDKAGRDADRALERKVESLFFREDFRRAQLDEIGSITYAAEAEWRYREGFLAAIDAQTVAMSNPHIVIDYGQGATAGILPALLDQIGCKVVALGAGVEDNRLAQAGADVQETLKQLQAITGALPTELGVSLEMSGERIALVDGQGRPVPPMTALAAITALALQAYKERGDVGGPSPIVAVPVTAPSILETIAERYGGTIQRTKANSQAIMAAATADNVILAGDGDGGLIFPQFHASFDAMFAVAKVLELLATLGTSLGAVVSSLPRYYQSTTSVTCAWESKGKVMRMLNENYRNQRGRHIDGIRIEMGDEWVLVLPDADRPLFHIVAEARSEQAARSLAEKYASVVNGLQR